MPQPSRARRPSRARNAPYSLRLSFTERAELEAASLRRGEYVAEYLRRSALEAARRELVASTWKGQP